MYVCFLQRNGIDRHSILIYHIFVQEQYFKHKCLRVDNVVDCHYVCQLKSEF